MKKKLTLLLGLILGFTAISCGLLPAKAIAANEKSNIAFVYRVYNPNTGEHFYTTDAKEKAILTRAGWIDEGVGWTAPAESNTPVYRLYSEEYGIHIFFTEEINRDFLIEIGLKDEGIAWYSDDEATIPIYGDRNPNVATGNRNYTANKEEHDNLMTAGWVDEGVRWYGKSIYTPPAKR